MIKVIETNISFDDNNNFADHQSRVVEVESWQDLIEEVFNQKTIIRESYLGNMMGCIIPKMCVIDRLIYDDFHLSCNISTYNGFKIQKLLYKIV
jgi:hypothetical protein